MACLALRGWTKFGYINASLGMFEFSLILTQDSILLSSNNWTQYLFHCEWGTSIQCWWSFCRAPETNDVSVTSNCIFLWINFNVRYSYFECEMRLVYRGDHVKSYSKGDWVKSSAEFLKRTRWNRTLKNYFQPTLSHQNFDRQVRKENTFWSFWYRWHDRGLMCVGVGAKTILKVRFHLVRFKNSSRDFT